jgi:hypothetical protein
MKQKDVHRLQEFLLVTMQTNKQISTGRGNSFSLYQHHNERPSFLLGKLGSKIQRLGCTQNGPTWQMIKTTSICTFAVHPSLPSQQEHKDIIT